MTKVRMGTFYVKKKDILSGKILSLLSEIEFIPTDVHYHPGRAGVEYTYTGYANIFPEIKEDDLIPIYGIVKEDNKIKVFKLG